MIKNKHYSMTSFQAAEVIGVTPDYIRRLIADGKLKSVKLGHNHLLNPKEVSKFKRKRFPKE